MNSKDKSNNVMEQDAKCCVVTCDLELGKEYWDNQYKAETTRWDLHAISPPLKQYIDQIDNKNLSILIPGCGNTYEAEYLLEKGFTNVTVIDIAPSLTEKLAGKFKGNQHINIITGDFFEHQGKYDLILEQTFFCAISPSLRKKYADKMQDLLKPGGRLAGVLFDIEFEHQGPPFGGCKCQYEGFFESGFIFKTFEPCYNSHPKRANTELFINLVKK